MMKESLLLVFIHGFKGGEDTFGEFPSQLRIALGRTYPSLEIRNEKYLFATQGDFPVAVTAFRSWLENMVIDMETSKGTISPTLNPSVKVILLCHSMGGLVGADAVLQIYEEMQPEEKSDGEAHTQVEETVKVPSIWPRVIGICAFDSPYLGLHPRVWAENVWEKGNGLYQTAQTVASLIPAGVFAAKSSQTSTKSSTTSWTTIAGAVGAAALAAGGGAIAYQKRQTLGSGFSWIQDHLQFVGTLIKGGELASRTKRICACPGIGFEVWYTALRDAKKDSGGGPSGIGNRGKSSENYDASRRTFCILPQGGDLLAHFHEQRNTKADDEIAAHTTMFLPAENPGYYHMADQTLEYLTAWIGRE